MRYGGTALKAGYVHEMSVRLLLHAVVSAAAKYGREVRPLLSCSVDFYVRIFVRILDSPVNAKHAAANTGLVHQCVQCDSFFVQRLGEVLAKGGDRNKFRPARAVTPGTECPECCGRMEIGGPAHVGPIHDLEFVQMCIDACDNGETNLAGITCWKKIRGMLTAISEELPDVPLHYRLPNLLKSLKVTPMPLRQFRGTLTALGYRVSHFHREPEAVKTDAPNVVVYDLLRVWAKEHTLGSGTRFQRILDRDISLTLPLKWEMEPKQKQRIAKFVPNPQSHWGPKARAHGIREKQKCGDHMGKQQKVLTTEIPCWPCRTFLFFVKKKLCCSEKHM